LASGPGLDDLEVFVGGYGAWERTHVPRTIEASPQEEIYQT
jgi:hypothetical protein